MEDDNLSQSNAEENDLGLPTLITLMRIYDVQMSILTHLDETAARNLHSEHEAGNILFSLPRLSPNAGDID